MLVEKKQFAGAPHEWRVHASPGPVLPSSLSERAVVQVPRRCLERCALVWPQVQRLGQQGHGVPPRRTTHASLDVADAAGADIGALRQLVLGQSSSKAMTAEQHTKGRRC
jgi:hypothetical protein